MFVGPSAHLFVRPLVCSFCLLSALDLSSYLTNFVQSSEIHSIQSEDVHTIFWSWSIEFSMSHCHLTTFVQATPGRYFVTRNNFLARTCGGGILITLVIALLVQSTLVRVHQPFIKAFIVIFSWVFYGPGSGAYSFWPVRLSFCLSAKAFTLAIAFEW